MTHVGTSPRFLGLVCLSLWLGWGVSLARAADPVQDERIEVTTCAGSPLGVGKFTVHFERGKPAMLSRGQSLWLSARQNRVLYPVYSTSSTTLPTDLERTSIDSATAYFLFLGDDPLHITLDVEQSHQKTSQPRVDPQEHAQLLSQWWRLYSAAQQRVIGEASYPPQVENYLTSMLARRLKQNHLRSAPSWSGRPDLDLLFGTLVGAESVRLAMQKDRFLDKPQQQEKADRPLPVPARVPAVELPAIAADVAIEPVAYHVPAECYYIRCGNYPTLQWMLNTLDERGADLRDVMSVRGLDYDVRRRIEDQLVLRENLLAKFLGDKVIADVAVIGTDTFFREGAATGVLFQAKSNALLSAAISSQRSALVRENSLAKEVTLKIANRSVSFLSTPDNFIRSFYAVDGDFHLITTSQSLVQRFFEAGTEKEALGNLAEFRFARSLMPHSRQDTLFIYLSDPFFRLLVSPQYRVEMTRRMNAEIDLELVTLARLAAQAEKQPHDTLQQLIDGGFLPSSVGQRPDGSRPVVQNGRVIDSLRGARRSFLPIPDVTLSGLTPSEVQSYEEFSRLYANLWQRMDPVIVGLKRTVQGDGDRSRERLVCDVHITPYAQQHYGGLAQFLAQPQKQQLGPVTGNLLSLEAMTNPIFSNAEGAAPLRYFAGLRDLSPTYALHNGRVVIHHNEFDRVPVYVGVTPPQSSFLIDTRELPEGDTERPNIIGLKWVRKFSPFVALSTQKSTLDAVTPQLKVVAAERPAQIRLQVADLNETKLADLLHTYGYVRARQTSAANVHFFHALMQQLRVEPEDCPKVAETILGGRPVCALGGEFQLKKFGPGPVRWISKAWPDEYLAQETQPPRNYRFPPLHSLRGLSIEFSIDRTTLSTHVELELTPK